MQEELAHDLLFEPHSEIDDTRVGSGPRGPALYFLDDVAGWSKLRQAPEIWRAKAHLAVHQGFAGVQGQGYLGRRRAGATLSAVAGARDSLPHDQHGRLRVPHQLL